MARAELKSIVAREWLLLLGGVALGLALMPVVLSLWQYTDQRPCTLTLPRDFAALLRPRICGPLWRIVPNTFAVFFKALSASRHFEVAWLVTLPPYAIMQLIRSVRWATRNALT